MLMLKVKNQMEKINKLSKYSMTIWWSSFSIHVYKKNWKMGWECPTIIFVNFLIG